MAPAYRRRPSGASTPTPPGRTGPPAAPSGCAIRRDPSRHLPQAPAGCRPAATRPAGPSSHQQKREGVQGGAAARTYWAPHHIARPKKWPPCRTGFSQGQYGGGVGFGSGRCWECAHPGGGRRGWSGVRRCCVERETSAGGVGGLRRMFLEISSYLPVEISRGTVKWPSGGAELYGGE